MGWPLCHVFLLHPRGWPLLAWVLNQGSSLVLWQSVSIWCSTVPFPLRPGSAEAQCLPDQLSNKHFGTLLRERLQEGQHSPSYCIEVTLIQVPKGALGLQVSVFPKSLPVYLQLRLPLSFTNKTLRSSSCRIACGMSFNFQCVWRS